MASETLSNSPSQRVVGLPQVLSQVTSPLATLKLSPSSIYKRIVSAPVNMLFSPTNSEEDKSAYTKPSSPTWSESPPADYQATVPSHDEEEESYRWVLLSVKDSESKAKQLTPSSLLQQLVLVNVTTEDDPCVIKFCDELDILDAYKGWEENLHTVWDGGANGQGFYVQLREAAYRNISNKKTYTQCCLIKLAPNQPKWPFPIDTLKYLPIGDLLFTSEYRPTRWCVVLGEDDGIWLLRDEEFGVAIEDEQEPIEDEPELSKFNFHDKRIDVVENLDCFGKSVIVRAGDLDDLLNPGEDFLREEPSSWLQFQGVWVCVGANLSYLGD